MTLVACMCNHPERLAEALEPLPLLLPAPVGRWGLGSVVGGEVLLARTPRPADGALDLAAAIAGQRSDCVIAQVLEDDRGPTPPGARSTALGDDIPPFRFRRWMLGEDPTGTLDGPTYEALVARIPEFLRRNLRGRTTGELTLHTVIALLYDQGLTDDTGLALPALARVTVEAIAHVAAGLVAAGLVSAGLVSAGQVSAGLVSAGQAKTGPAGASPGTTPAPRFAGGNVAVSNSRALAVAAIAAPLAVYPLRVWNDRGARDESFRGVVIASGLPAPRRRNEPSDAVPELVPVGSMVTVSRDLRVAIVPMP